MEVELLDGPGAAAAEDAILAVYAEAFAEPPYLKTAADVAANRRRFRSQVRKPTFRAALATTTAGGEPVAMAYGYPLSPATGWWARLITPVPEELSRETGSRTFGLIELAVRATWRRQGVARRLHDALLDGPEERVLLNARPDAAPAQAAYRSWGYRIVGRAHPWDGAALHDVMLKELHPHPTTTTRT
ncbi:GNAT family N-acetyltransferase [Streptomyces avicenniae]|uniref:GNAT family N-acetyltransferase n=1 Tax=Streptomyces avicenniae TaxID=500153 RepID=UPI00069B0CBD|nr:GNAT family N-acetyltransferase [Streptomyces avicenniae]